MLVSNWLCGKYQRKHALSRSSVFISVDVNLERILKVS